MCDNPNPPTVLIVDNDGHGRKFLSETLRGMGYRTLVAENGPDAMALSASETVDLLISDLIMPGMLGAELSKVIRTKFPDAKQIFMSGFPRHAARQFGYLPNAPFLEKPIAVGLLRKTVAELLPWPAAVHAMAQAGA